MTEQNNNTRTISKGFEIPKSPFISYLEELATRDDRGALAAIRKGLQYDPGKCADTYPYIIPWLGNVKSKWEKDVHYLIASLFAYHPSSISQPQNIGDVFSKISLKRGDTKSLEKRFKNLLKSKPEDLPLHMRQVISLAKSESIPVNWHELFYDLKRWPYESTFPPYEKWANSFWKYKAKQKNES